MSLRKSPFNCKILYIYSRIGRNQSLKREADFYPMAKLGENWGKNFTLFKSPYNNIYYTEKKIVYHGAKF